MHQKTLTELSAALAAGEFSAEELARHFLERIGRFDGELNSFITVTGELALEQAREADRLRAAGRAGPLTGLPIAHKDIFCTDGVLTSCASRMLENFIAPYDATVVSRLREAGMVLLGKTNMDEFAMGSSNETSFYGAVLNPWTTSGSRAAPPAARPPPWPRAWLRSPPVPIPAVPSASRRP